MAINTSHADTRREAQADHESARREAQIEATGIRREAQIESDHDLLVKMCERVEDLVGLIKGNGQPGQMQRIAALELWRSMLVGAWLLLTALVAIYGALKR